MRKRELALRAVIVVVTTIAMAAIVPALLRMLTDAPAGYPYVQYSSVMREFCTIDYSNKSWPLTDLRGRHYNNEEFDSIMPLLNFRQLVADGRQPDSLAGIALTPNIVMAKSVVYTHYPIKTNHPRLGLYIMYESAPKRLGLDLPDDIFALDTAITFYRNEVNDIDTAKSRRFNEALHDAGFQFPCTMVEGNMSPRKRYDEGYFCLDANESLYHVKMVDGEPFVRSAQLPDSISVRAFAPYEPGDKRFFGFIFDKRNDIYILERDSDDYRAVRIDVGKFDIEHDNLKILGNLLYWTVTIQTSLGSTSYALESQTLRCIDTLHITATEDTWHRVARRTLPIYIDMDNQETKYISPQIVWTGWQALITNVILAVLSAMLWRGNRRWKVGVAVYVILTGIAGALAVWLVGRGRQD